MTRTDYALLDAGDGRRLERFGARIVDRPAATADGPVWTPGPWTGADLRFDRRTGWAGHDQSPWLVEIDDLPLELRPTDAGHVGLFPEHAAHWPFLAQRAADADVLHLFAYTGATTLALARAGARIVHVDASRPTVQWARRNAERAALAAATVRWIVDDAVGFVAREVRRGRRYTGVVLDPPTYGHGTGGRPWRLEEHLADLLAAIGQLAPRFVLLTAHTPGWDPDRLADALDTAGLVGTTDGGRQELLAESGARLALGAWARVIIEP